MKEELFKYLSTVATAFGIDSKRVNLEYTEDSTHGDFASSVAMAAAKDMKINPRALADKIIAELTKSMPSFVEKIEVAGPGFINFTLKDSVLAGKVVEISRNHSGKNKPTGAKVMVEYTDPNPFKIFHIGHLMANAVGESVSRLIEYSGVEVVRACYQGDVGLHVAKTVWAIKKKGIPNDFASKKTILEKVAWLGECYVEGSSHEDDETIKKEIAEVNKKVFDRSDVEINKIYDAGRKWSLEYFDTIYARLGTKFDRFFFESEVGTKGLEVVNSFLDKGVFQKSDGAVVFKGEEHGLHTRVFVNSQGLPTYEAKEVGLNLEKFKLHPDLTESVIVTGNEINDYFKVLKKVLSIVAPAVAEKTTHLSHGMLRFTSGKMSSRKGNIISAEDLIDDTKKLVAEKMVGRNFSSAEAAEISDMVAVAAIKYSILRQGIGGDVIFDPATSISFEGDSGPYLQYSAVRAQSVLNKVSWLQKLFSGGTPVYPEKVGLLEKLIVRFPDVAKRARAEYAPQQVASYLIELAGAFNSFYAHSPILDSKEPLSKYRIALTRAFLTTMNDGLWLLGIRVPKKM